MVDSSRLRELKYIETHLTTEVTFHLQIESLLSIWHAIEIEWKKTYHSVRKQT